VSNKRESFKALLTKKPDTQEPVAPNLKKAENTETKKATFELSSELHTTLKIYAAANKRNMVDVVEEALKQYFQ
jgi:hypothetical protein